jgi:Tol biopolymer transport system component
MFLLNDSVRNEGFGNLYMYNSNTKEVAKLNPINGECCYRDARWSPDGKYIFFAFQKSGDTNIELYYMPVDGSENGWPTAIELPAGFFSTPREKPQSALRPID